MIPKKLPLNGLKMAVFLSAVCIPAMAQTNANIQRPATVKLETYIPSTNTLMTNSIGAKLVVKIEAGSTKEINSTTESKLEIREAVSSAVTVEGTATVNGTPTGFVKPKGNISIPAWTKLTGSFASVSNSRFQDPVEVQNALGMVQSAIVNFKAEYPSGTTFNFDKASVIIRSSSHSYRAEIPSVTNYPLGSISYNLYIEFKCTDPTVGDNWEYNATKLTK